MMVPILSVAPPSVAAIGGPDQAISLSEKGKEVVHRLDRSPTLSAIELPDSVGEVMVSSSKFAALDLIDDLEGNDNVEIHRVIDKVVKEGKLSPRKSQAAAAMLSHSSVGLLDSGMEVLKQRLEFLRSREEPVKQGPSSGPPPTLVCGDFNVITSPEEKLGGRPFKVSEAEDFIEFMDVASLVDVGSRFTWCNNRFGRARVPRSFRFLNVWVAHHSFLDVVREAWSFQSDCRPIKALLLKLKKVKEMLLLWNKDVFGNVVDRAARLVKKGDGTEAGGS
uniref:Endonuclease/exonuclease/phosphatase domain-containing protein n=1 Tax=Ananas comosus var. bracteatus TaxID=296719 RepID=A0A6V7PYJ9_ANACO|nr:unnamed protein product [Ananas comosus var. bracteatus]